MRIEPKRGVMKAIAIAGLLCFVAIPAALFQSTLPPAILAALMLVIAIALVGIARQMKKEIRLLVIAREGIVEVTEASAHTIPWGKIADVRVTKLGVRCYIVIQREQDSEKIEVNDYDITPQDLQAFLHKVWPVGHEALPPAADLGVRT